MQQRPATARRPPLRLRFASNVQHRLHLGEARIALFNWLWARKHGGVLVLRVEDGETERCTEVGLEALREDLRWLGVDWDEGPKAGGPFGPYQRTSRRVLYRAEADRLLRQGAAFRCFCAPSALSAAGVHPECKCADQDAAATQRRAESGVASGVRLRIPAGAVFAWNDLVQGEQSAPAEAIGQPLLLAAEGTPADDFAAVVDDGKMHISQVLRGREDLERTPRQLACFDALGYARPEFGHLPALLGAEGLPLEPRVGEPTVAQCRDRGILPYALVNFLALLGWSYDRSQEVFAPHELVAHLDLPGLRRDPAVLDLEKLLWLNREHFARLSLGAKLECLLLQMRAQGLWPPRFRVELSPQRHFRVVTGSLDEKVAASIQPIPEEEWMMREPTVAEELPRLAQIVAALGDGLAGPHDVASALACFYDDGFGFDPRAVQKHLNETSAAQLAEFAAELESVHSFLPETLEAALYGTAARLGVPPSALRHAALVALTGRDSGPSVFDVLYLLGRPKSLERLRRAGDIVRRDRELPPLPGLGTPDERGWTPTAAPPGAGRPDSMPLAAPAPPPEDPRARPH